MTARMRQTLVGWPTWAREAFTERAGIGEYCGGLSRDMAEQQAFIALAPRVRASKEDET